ACGAESPAGAGSANQTEPKDPGFRRSRAGAGRSGNFSGVVVASHSRYCDGGGPKNPIQSWGASYHRREGVGYRRPRWDSDSQSLSWQALATVELARIRALFHQCYREPGRAGEPDRGAESPITPATASCQARLLGGAQQCRRGGNYGRWAVEGVYRGSQPGKEAAVGPGNLQDPTQETWL